MSKKASIIGMTPLRIVNTMLNISQRLSPGVMCTVDELMYLNRKRISKQLKVQTFLRSAGSSGNKEDLPFACRLVSI
jgi:hypothetical protein